MRGSRRPKGCRRAPQGPPGTPTALCTTAPPGERCAQTTPMIETKSMHSSDTHPHVPDTFRSYRHLIHPNSQLEPKTTTATSSDGRPSANLCDALLLCSAKFWSPSIQGPASIGFAPDSGANLCPTHTPNVARSWATSAIVDVDQLDMHPHDLCALCPGTLTAQRRALRRHPGSRNKPVA